MADRSDSGWRLVASVKDAPAKLGEIVAIREGDAWSLAVVRRMQRHQVDEVTVGVEIIAPRLVRVLLRAWVTPAGFEPTRSRASVLRPLPARASREPAGLAAEPDRTGREIRARRDGRARYRKRSLPDPIHADARAPGGLGVGAVQRGAQADPRRSRPPGAASPSGGPSGGSRRIRLESGAGFAGAGARRAAAGATTRIREEIR